MGGVAPPVSLRQTLPITVDRVEPTRLRVRWGEVEAHHAVGRGRAETFAAALRRGD